MDSTVSNYPGVIVTDDGRGGGRSGWEGKDAVFAHQIDNSTAHRDLVFANGLNSKQDAVLVQESKFQLARDIAEVNVRAERLERENQNKLDDIRREVLNAVKSEAIATREMLRDDKLAEQAALIAELKAQLLKGKV